MFVPDFSFENVSEVLVLVVFLRLLEAPDHHVEVGHDHEIEHLLKHWDFHVPGYTIDRWLEVPEERSFRSEEVCVLQFWDSTAVNHDKLVSVHRSHDYKREEESELDGKDERHEDPHQVQQTEDIVVHVGLNANQNPGFPHHDSRNPFVHVSPQVRTDPTLLLVLGLLSAFVILLLLVLLTLGFQEYLLLAFVDCLEFKVLVQLLVEPHGLDVKFWLLVDHLANVDEQALSVDLS